MNITVDKLNDVPSSDLITKNTNQTLGYVSMETLDVVHIYADKINGVPVDKAARMNQENIIKGFFNLYNFFLLKQTK